MVSIPYLPQLFRYYVFCTHTRFCTFCAMWWSVSSILTPMLTHFLSTHFNSCSFMVVLGQNFRMCARSELWFFFLFTFYFGLYSVFYDFYLNDSFIKSEFFSSSMFRTLYHGKLTQTLNIYWKKKCWKRIELKAHVIFMCLCKHYKVYLDALHFYLMETSITIQKY